MRTYYAVDDEVDNRPFDATDVRQIEAQAQREGITVGQLMGRAGMVRTPDGGFEWREPNPGKHRGLRYAYHERNVFRTEDPLGIEWAIVPRRGSSSKTAPTITSATRHRSS